MIPNKELMEQPFALCCLAGVRFSTLLANHITYSGHSRADIATMAGCTERQIKACVQGDATPSGSVRRAMKDCIGFDPWKVYRDVQNKTYRLDKESHFVLNQVEQEYYSVISEEAAQYFDEGDHNGSRSYRGE